MTSVSEEVLKMEPQSSSWRQRPAQLTRLPLWAMAMKSKRQPAKKGWTLWSGEVEGPAARQSHPRPDLAGGGQIWPLPATFFFAARPNLAAASWTWLSHELELGGGVGWEKEGGRREGMEEIRNVNSFVWEMGIHMYMLTFVDYLLNNKSSRFV